MTKAIVFDLDGTLLDTLTDLTNYALRSCGMPEHSIDDVRRFVGNGVRMLMTRAVPDGESNPRFDEAFSVFRQHYMQHCLDTTCPYPGIMDALAGLKEKGMMPPQGKGNDVGHCQQQDAGGDRGVAAAFLLTVYRCCYRGECRYKEETCARYRQRGVAPAWH